MEIPSLGIFRRFFLFSVLPTCLSGAFHFGQLAICDSAISGLSIPKADFPLFLRIYTNFVDRISFEIFLEDFWYLKSNLFESIVLYNSYILRFGAVYVFIHKG